MKQIEALKLALRSLKELVPDESDFATALQGQRMRQEKAIKACQKALAEQPEQQHDQTEIAFEAWWQAQGQFHRSGGGDYEKTFAWHAWLASLACTEQPAQQEPVGLLSVRYHRGCKSMTNTDFDYNGDLPEGDYELYTSPPAQRKPLTDGLPCCGYTDASAIKWNEFNHAVQCHNCGQTYTQTPNKPLTLEYIDQHIGADEGDREAVVALVREVEAAHGIKENT